jgi:hypothetical protein
MSFLIGGMSSAIRALRAYRGQHASSAARGSNPIMTRIFDSGSTLTGRLTAARAGFLNNLNNPQLLNIPNISDIYSTYLGNIVSGGTVFDRIAKIFSPFDQTQDKLDHFKEMLADGEGMIKTNAMRMLSELLEGFTLGLP